MSYEHTTVILWFEIKITETSINSQVQRIPAASDSDLVSCMFTMFTASLLLVGLLLFFCFLVFFSLFDVLVCSLFACCSVVQSSSLLTFRLVFRSCWSLRHWLFWTSTWAINRTRTRVLHYEAGFEVTVVSLGFLCDPRGWLLIEVHLHGNRRWTLDLLRSRWCSR